jgi:hypothetical protein
LYPGQEYHLKEFHKILFGLNHKRTSSSLETANWTDSVMTSSPQSGYGAIDTSSNGQPYRLSDEDNAPLLASPRRSKYSIAKRIRSHMTRDIDTTHGNTVYLGLGLTDPYGGTRWIKAAVSVGCFCAGSFVFARYHRALSPRKRWVLVTSHLFQALLTMAAALIVMYDTNEPSGNELHWQVLVPIALVAFQAAGQAVTSRVLNVKALTSVVLTSIYCDLFSDANLFAGIMQDRGRNQMVAAPIALLIGVIGGGLWAKSAVGMAGALWSAVGMKLLIILAWLSWKSA